MSEYQKTTQESGLFWNLLPAAKRAELIEISTPKRYRAFDTLVDAGDVSEHIFLVESGRVHALTASRNDQEMAVRAFGPASFITWSFCFRREVSMFDFVAQTELKVRKIELESFEKLVQKDEYLMLCLLQVLIDRCDDAYSFIKDLLVESSLVRVAHLLGRLTLKFGEEKSGKLYLNEFSHQDIANLSGLSRPQVSQALGVLQEKRLVVLGREDIQIVDAEKLSRLCVQAAVA
jgi:CRP-like cAMP-binding protein